MSDNIHDTMNPSYKNSVRSHNPNNNIVFRGAAFGIHFLQTKTIEQNIK